MSNLTDPVLVNTTVLTALLVPITCEAKTKLLGESFAEGAFTLDGAVVTFDDVGSSLFGSAGDRPAIKRHD